MLGQSASSERPRIVLVEDDPSLRSALAFSLEADGFDVATHARAASLLERTPGVDCLVVDFKLPDLDGLSLLEQLRDRGLLTPAILITTNPDQRCRRRASALGVEIVEKPLIDGELRRRIDALVA